jgi:hypothetical protein
VSTIKKWCGSAKNSSVVADSGERCSELGREACARRVGDPPGAHEGVPRLYDELNSSHLITHGA